MTAALIVGVLAALAGLAILRPGSSARRGFTVTGTDENLRRELLHQLRDLDDDLADGKLADADHRRLRGPVEGELATVLHRIETRATAEQSLIAAEGRSGPRPRRLRWVAVGLVGAVAIAGVAVTLAGAIDTRDPGEVISGGARQAAPAEAGSLGSAPGGGAVGPGDDGQLTAPVPTAEQVAAVNAAVARVKDSPQDVAAHLDLARAYTAAGQPQLSTIEYLAVTELEPANAEANVALALVAFLADEAQQAKQMVDKVLVAHPGHPEALYARGLIQMMGLKQPAPAKRDLQAYLEVAPFGSHRETVQTLLTMLAEQPSK